jgi:ribonuclease HI
MAPSKEAFYFSYRLEYDCTNNVFEYESLLIGLNIDLDRSIRCLKVIGDSNVVISQVNLKFAVKNERLRRYRDLV